MKRALTAFAVLLPLAVIASLFAGAGHLKAQQRTPVPNIPLNDAMGQFWSLKTVDDGSGNQQIVTVPGSGSGVSGLAAVVSTAAEGSHVLKASAGNLYDLYVTTTIPGYLMVFAAASAPADGAVTPQDCVYIPSNQTATLMVAGAPPEAFTTGITAVFSTTGCFTKTVSATAYFHGRVQ